MCKHAAYQVNHDPRFAKHYAPIVALSILIIAPFNCIVVLNTFQTKYAKMLTVAKIRYYNAKSRYYKVLSLFVYKFYY
jgi:hypothetical protein